MIWPVIHTFPHCEFDVAVVGGGPAGLAAATWLGRYRCRVILFDSGEYRNRWTELVHGYLGDDPARPADLRARTHRDLAQYPMVRIQNVMVDSITKTGGGLFELRAAERTVTAARVILATGTRDQFPEVTGFFEHYGSEVFHCPLCDGYEARGRHVAVFGWDDKVGGFARKMLNWAASVTVVTHGCRLTEDKELYEELGSKGIEVIDDDPVELMGPRGDLKGVKLSNGRTLSCNLLFFSLPEYPVNALAKQLGCELGEKGHVSTGKNGLTSVEGVYAAGDITPGEQLVQVAAAEGALAATACAESLIAGGARRWPEPAPYRHWMARSREAGEGARTSARPESTT